MSKQKVRKESEKQLTLGDYVTFNMSSLKSTRVNNIELSDLQVYREELLQRIKRQRGEIIQTNHQRQGGDLIDVRLCDTA